MSRLIKYKWIIITIILIAALIVIAFVVRDSIVSILTASATGAALIKTMRDKWLDWQYRDREAKNAIQSYKQVINNLDDAGIDRELDIAVKRRNRKTNKN